MSISDSFGGLGNISLNHLRSLVGQQLQAVGYRGELSDFHDATAQDVDQAVVLTLESVTVVLEWYIDGVEESLRLVVAPDEAATKDIPARDVSALRPWRSVVGSRIVSFGAATQEAETGSWFAWALRIGFSNGEHIVVALGELEGESVRYQPENLVVLSDPEMAQSYQVLDAPESAWGRDIAL
ncbi:hypothetical protein GCM10009804_35090 [Kribbella hippodromi]|uniref:Uncharacterized protein n=1 Tax=Kribbella hippodromi TaxID=434347 RepID=A0ABN2DGA3_9ACTN